MLALISFDAPSVEVLERLCDEGRLPRLSELRASGRTIPLSTSAARFPAGVYPTVWTGVPIEEHGLYYPFMWDASGQRVRVSESFPAPPAIWEPIARAGARAVVVDAYESRRPASIDGLYLSGWQFTNRVVMRPASTPHGVRRTLVRRFGPARPADEVFGEPDVRRLRDLAATLERAPGRLAQLVEETIADLRPDLLVAGLSSVHVAGHQLTDPSRVLARMDDAARGDLDGALERVYVAADRALGQIVDALPAGADVVVFAAHGMAPDVSRTDLLGSMLDLVLRGAHVEEVGARGGWGFRAAVPASLRAHVGRLLPDRAAMALAARLELVRVDWRSTRAFVVPSDAQGLIRLNVRRRERRGIVDADDVPGLVEEIRTGLESFSLESGAPAVAGIHAASALAGAAGSPSDLLPDLVVTWAAEPTRRGERLVSSRFGVVRRAGAGSGRSGNHTDDAWALVVAGAGRSRELETADIGDIAATALARFGFVHAGVPLLEAA